MSDTDPDSTDNAAKFAAWLASLFEGWGVGETLAKLLAGALVGAALAAAAVGLPQCSATENTTQASLSCPNP